VDPLWSIEMNNKTSVAPKLVFISSHPIGRPSLILCYPGGTTIAHQLRTGTIVTRDVFRSTGQPLNDEKTKPTDSGEDIPTKLDNEEVDTSVFISDVTDQATILAQRNPTLFVSAAPKTTTTPSSSSSPLSKTTKSERKSPTATPGNARVVSAKKKVAPLTVEGIAEREHQKALTGLRNTPSNWSMVETPSNSILVRSLNHEVSAINLITGHPIVDTWAPGIIRMIIQSIHVT
jgi:hypothetical protein